MPRLLPVCLGLAVGYVLTFGPPAGASPPIPTGAPEVAPAPARVDRYSDRLPDGAVFRLGTVRWRHDDSIDSLAFSPDGRTIRSCAGGAFRLWDRETGRLLVKVGGAASGRATALSADGKTLAATGWRGGVRMWDVATGKELPTLGDKNEAHHPLALSPDGALLATGIDVSQRTGVRVWDVRTGKILHRFPWDAAGVYCVAFSPDGKTVAYGGSADPIWLFDTATGKERGRLKEASTPGCIAFSPDGKLLAAPTLGGAVRVWDVATGQLRLARAADEHRHLRGAVAFSPDAKTLAQGGADAIVLWDVATGTERRAIQTRDYTTALAFSPDGNVLASGGHGRTVQLWDVETGKSLDPPGGHEGVVTRVTYSPDGRALATASKDQTIRLWDAATGKELWRAEGHGDDVTEVIFTPDGCTLVSAGHDRTVRWWDATTGKELRRRAIEYRYTKLALSSDGKVLACEADSREIHLWDAATGKDPRLLGEHKTAIGTLAFAAGGAVLVSTGYYEPAIRLWDLKGGSSWRSLNYALPPGRSDHIPPLVAVSPDGRTVASQSRGGALQLWEVASGKERQRVCCVPVEDVATLAFSPDGRTLAVADRVGWVYFWSLAEGRVVARLNVGPLAYNAHPALTFSPDGRRLATIRDDTTVLVWPAPAYSPTEPHGRRPGEELWADLADTDAAKAYRASRELLMNPERAVTLLAKHLKPVAAPAANEVARLLKDLSDEEFAVREAATAAVEKLGAVAEPALREALRGSPTPEAKQRIEQTLKRLGALTPDVLRRGRALEVLEYAATREAVALLESLAAGAPGAWLTKEASASLERMTRRGVATRRK